MPAVTPESVPVSAPVAVNVAVGVGSLTVAVGSGRVILASAVGVPKTVIRVKLSRVTVTPFTDVTA